MGKCFFLLHFLKNFCRISIICFINVYYSLPDNFMGLEFSSLEDFKGQNQLIGIGLLSYLLLIESL